MASSGHASSGTARARAHAPCPTKAGPYPITGAYAPAIAAMGTSAVILLEVPSLSLAGEATCLARNATAKGRITDAKTLGAPSAYGRALPYEASDGA